METGEDGGNSGDLGAFAEESTEPESEGDAVEDDDGAVGFEAEEDEEGAVAAGEGTR